MASVQMHKKALIIAFLRQEKENGQKELQKLHSYMVYRGKVHNGFKHTETSKKKKNFGKNCTKFQDCGYFFDDSHLTCRF